MKVGSPGSLLKDGERGKGGEKAWPMRRSHHRPGCVRNTTLDLHGSPGRRLGGSPLYS